MILSNSICDVGQLMANNYKFDKHFIKICLSMLMTDEIAKSIKKPIMSIINLEENLRFPQSKSLFKKLERSLISINGADLQWMIKRGLNSKLLNDNKVKSVDYSKLSEQDSFDLNVIPDDCIVASHGPIPVIGPAFPDYRDGILVGIGIRNTSTDLSFVSDAKYTFSNYGWYIWGYDDYDSNVEVTLCEGVFDALALRSIGIPAIAFGSAYPSAFQLATVKFKFNKLRVCFDSDMWGNYGSYIISTILCCPIDEPIDKDVAQAVFETKSQNPTSIITIEELKFKLLGKIDEYNKVEKLVRNLPYNV